MKRAAAKIVLKLENFEQNQCRMDIAEEMFTTFTDDPDLLKKVITDDESWVYGHDTETKVQSYQWKRPEELKPKNPGQVLSMKRAATKIVLKFLNVEQKHCRMNISQKMLTAFNDDPDLLKKAITGDESWVYGYATETSPIIPMEAFRRAKTEKRVKFSQM